MAIRRMKNRRAFIAALGIALSVFLYLGAAPQDGYHGAGHYRWHQDFYAKLRSGFVLHPVCTRRRRGPQNCPSTCGGAVFGPVDLDAVATQWHGNRRVVAKPAQRYATLYRELVSEPAT